jgi:mannose-6-phosphate isomerase-like protein (cupin superfamily)
MWGRAMPDRSRPQECLPHDNKGGFVKARLIVLALALPLIAAEPPGYKYWSAADVKAHGQTLAKKMNAQKVASERIAELGNHYTMIAHREGTGEAELHDNEADVFVVSSGTAELIVGGSISNGKVSGPGETRGPSISGGTRQKIAAGDIVHIPSKTAHQMLVESGPVTYFVIKVKE